MLLYLLTAAATWRLTRMILLEHGPASMFDKLRQRVFSIMDGGGMPEQGTLPYLFTCHYCMSVWVAALVSIYPAPSLLSWALFTLAGSTGSIAIEEINQSIQNHWRLRSAEIDLYRLQIHGLRVRPTPPIQEDTEPSEDGP